MSAKDKYHHAVRNALIRDGWTITHDPYRIRIALKRMEIDLGAEQAIAAEREYRKIAVEVKSFLGDSELNDLENALGQYSLCRLMLLKKDPEAFSIWQFRTDCATCCCWKVISVMSCENFRFA